MRQADTDVGRRASVARRAAWAVAPAGEPPAALPRRSGIREELRAAGFSPEEVETYLRSAEGAAAAR